MFNVHVLKQCLSFVKIKKIAKTHSLQHKSFWNEVRHLALTHYTVILWYKIFLARYFFALITIPGVVTQTVSIIDSYGCRIFLPIHTVSFVWWNTFSLPGPGLAWVQHRFNSVLCWEPALNLHNLVVCFPRLGIPFLKCWEFW